MSWQTGPTECLKYVCSSYLKKLLNNICEPGRSVSIVSGYGLDDRAIEVRSPAKAKGFTCSLCVKTRSGAHPASCTKDTEDPFPGAKARPERDADHSLPPSAKVENEWEVYLLSPQAPSWL
jgi:hypothetical protein